MVGADWTVDELKPLLDLLRSRDVATFEAGTLKISFRAHEPPAVVVDPDELAAAKMPSDEEMLFASAGKGR